MTPAEVAAWTAASRARKGFGPKITDPAILRRIFILAFITTEAESEGGDRGAA